jgi:uncharacterized membrane protein
MIIDWEQVAASCHIAAAVTGLVSGAFVLTRRKGTRGHRRVGTLYAVCLLIVNVAALTVHREAAFGVFHWLAILSLATLAVGVLPMVLGRRTPGVIALHAYCMAWSYAGLVGAGCGQLAAATVSGARFGVMTAIVSVLALCAALIFWRVPSTLAQTLGSRTP